MIFLNTVTDTYMKQRISFLIVLLALATSSVHAQELYTRLAFGNTDFDSYQLIKRKYYSTTGAVVGPVDQKHPVTGIRTNTAHAYTAFGSTPEKLVLIIAQKDWLDLTNSVVVSGTGVSFSRILAKGVDRRGTSTQKSWVQIELNIQPSATAGVRTIRLRRPSLTGTDESTFRLNLHQNYRVLFQSAFTIGGQTTNARQAYLSSSEVRFSFEGHRLNLVTGIKNNGNTMANSIIRNLRFIEKGPGKLTFACNFVGEGKLTLQEFFSRYLNTEFNTKLLSMNCPGQNSCTFIRTQIENGNGEIIIPHIYLVYPSDAERGIR